MSGIGDEDHEGSGELGSTVTVFADLFTAGEPQGVAAVGARRARLGAQTLSLGQLVDFVVRSRHRTQSALPTPISLLAAREMPKAELLMVRGGTHVASIEQAELVDGRIREFFETRVAK